MGRSRAKFISVNEETTQRSRRKKNASSAENSESASAGQGSCDGKTALYHCNYCNKDITGRVRFKCSVCPDFDLCVECFSVGAEVQPHKSIHPYRVMDNLSFPLFCTDWNADDEILLLEGIEMYGLWNWTEVCEHVGTKSEEQCIEHYRDVYMNSPFFPLPNMSHVVGKNKNHNELLAMAKGHDEEKKGILVRGDLTMNEESSFSSSGVKVEDPHKGVGFLSGSGAGESEFCSSYDILDTDSGMCSSSTNSAATAPMEKSVFNPKRQEFDPEYDNDAEQLLVDMEFKETDSEDERELKLRVLRIYSKRLDERKRRKDFILDRNLLYPNPFEKNLSPEERAICRHYDVYMRFHTKKEHEDLLQTIISEYRIERRIQQLKESRAAGCRTSAEADAYLEETNREAKRSKDLSQVGVATGKGAIFSKNPRAASQASSSTTADDFNMLGYNNGADTLSDNVSFSSKSCRSMSS